MNMSGMASLLRRAGYRTHIVGNLAVSSVPETFRRFAFGVGLALSQSRGPPKFGLP